MAKRFQLRRGTNAESVAFTGALGEVVVDTTNKIVVVHDGTTAGGLSQAARGNADGTVTILNRAGTTLATIPSTGLLNNTLTSTATNQALTAAQGKVLQDGKLGISANAVSATILETARTINGVAFNGSANILVPVNIVDITPSTDLNSYQTVGFYRCTLDEIAATLTNRPTSTAFAMLVERGAGIVQTVTEYMTSGSKTFKRHGYSGAWGSWYEVLNSATGAITGTITAPTPADGTNTTQLATTAFVQNTVGGYLSKTGLTGGTVTLTDTEVSNAVLYFAGTLTSNLTVTVPVTNKRLWAAINGTTGAFTLTIKTPSGTGVTVAQGKRNLIYTDGTNVQNAFNDFESIALTGTPTSTTAAVGTNTTQVATTAFVNAEIANDAPTKTGSGASGTWGISITGNAATATSATSATTAGTCTGNAATATKLATARTIGGVSFDGTANINLAGVNATGNQDTTGNAATATALSTATGSAPSYAARAFVTFDASTGTPVVSASGNVTSITDNGVGDFTVNFTTAMPDANYAIAGVTGNKDVTASPAAASLRAQSGAITTTSCRVRTANHFINSGAAAYDMPYNSVIIFR